MRTATAALLCVLALLVTGCWDRLELNDWGFVQSAAIDLTDEGRIRLSALVYRPGGSPSQSMDASQSGTFINVSGTDSTVFGASLKLSTVLGRRLQWSQLDTLLLGERLAHSRNTADVLDFFSRSNEPKNAFPIIVTQGEAQPYLQARPIINNSVGRQLNDSVHRSRDLTSMSMPVTLTDMTILAKEPSAAYVLPYIAPEDSAKDQIRASIVLIRFPEGKVGDVVPSRLAPYLLMLMNKYRYGMLQLPCEGNEGSGQQDTFTIHQAHAAVKPEARADKLHLTVTIRANGNAKELMCSSLMSQEEIDRFTERAEQELQKRLTETMNFLKQQQADVIGAGTHLHRWHNSLWKQWKKDWPARFGAAEVTIRVEAKLMNNGVDTGKPLATTEQIAAP